MGESKAIIISTHILEEVDAVCTKVAIIDRGRLIAEGSPAELKARASSAGTVVVKVAGVSNSELAKALEGVDGVERTAVDGDEVRVLPRKSGDAAKGLAAGSRRRSAPANGRSSNSAQRKAVWTSSSAP
jgi:ABC-2 type transport system ATP-binding protein